MRLWTLRPPQSFLPRCAGCNHERRSQSTFESALRSAVHERNEQRRQKQKPNLAFNKPVNSGDSAEASRARHLLRASLRECRYLPDYFARQWITQQTLSRFRTYGFKAWKHRDDELFQERLMAKEREARQALNQLKRANEGDRKCLLKVLLMAYGRIGKRRHELMKPLLPVKGQQDAVGDVGTRAHHAESTLPAETQDPVAKGSVESHKSYATPLLTPTDKLELTPQLRALLQSQIQASPPDLTRPNPRRLQPEIPYLNTWLRPMPQKRIKNMQKKHYAQLLDRLLPPLPTEEWYRLRDLASGKLMPEDRPRPLRGLRAVRIRTEPEKQSSLEMVVTYGKVPKTIFKNKNAHEITPRFMRRLYAQVFSQCPLMGWDVRKNEWKVTWGEKALYSTSSSARNASGEMSEEVRVNPEHDLYGQSNTAAMASG